MKKLSLLIILLSVLVFNGTESFAVNYYSGGSLTPNLTANWWTNTNGTGSHPANFSTVGDIFTVQSAHNMTLTADWSVSGSLIINGTLTNNGTTTITVGGNVSVTGGLIDLASKKNAIGNLNVTGNITVSAGKIDLASFNGGSTGTVNVTGLISVTGGTIDLAGGNSGVGELDVFGDFTYTSGTITNSSGTGSIIFGKSGTQTYTGTQAFAAKVINFTVNSGSFLQMGTGASPSVISGSTGTFTVSSGATLGVTSPYGITFATTGATGGNIQVTGVRTYSAGTNYIYNGSANQAAGDGLSKNNPANVEIKSSVGTSIISLSASTTISGSLKMTQGILDLKGFCATVGDLQGSGNITHSVAGTDTITTGSNNASTTYSGTISNSTGTVCFIKNGSGTLTLGNANTYTGFTSINAGTVVLGAANVLPSSSNVILGGGTIKTGGTTGYSATVGTLNISQNSTIALGTGVHALTFANSQSENWTSGAFLTITGWTGVYNGASSGTAGQIYVSASSSGLKAAQLSQIQFLNGTDSKYYPAVILGTGEVVPGGTPLVLSNLIYTSPNFFVRGSAITTLTPSITNNGATLPITYSVSPALPTGLSLNTSTGAITGTPTVSQNLATYTITAKDSHTPSNSTTFGIQILVHTPLNFYAIANGDWNTKSTWSNINGLSSSTPASATPLPGDNIYIGDATANGDRTVTIQGGYSAACASIFVGPTDNSNINSNLTMTDAAASLSVTGNITLQRSTRNAALLSSLNIDAGSVAVGGAVSMTGGTNATSQIVITTGSLSITGNLDESTGTTANQVINMTAGNLTLGGNWLNNGSFTVGTSAVTFNGTTTQSLTLATAMTFYDLTINNGSTLNAGSCNYTIGGNWVNNGTFTPGTGTVTFAGTTQSLSGTSLQTFNNLAISPGNSVTIPAPVNVTVNGTLTNTTGNAGLVLQSSATGSASLIHNTASTSATVQRYMIGNQWHNIASAVSNQTVNGFITNAANNIPVSGANYGMEYYSEAGAGWTFYTTSSTPGNLVPGTGYMVRNTTDGAVSSAGALTAANTDVVLTRTKYGWNSVGNPFPCSIGVRSDASTTENFLTKNAAQLDPSYAALYVWDGTAYKIISNAGFTPPGGKALLDQAYMQPGQGFVVKSKTGGATVSFTTAMRLHENTASNFKSAKVPWPGINVKVSSATKSTSTAIALNEKMTKGLDPTYDAGQFGGDATFKLYSRLVEDNGINFALQCLPMNGFDSMTVPLGFDCSTTGNVTFSADVVSLPDGMKAILVDSLLHKYTDLSDSTAKYTVALTSTNAGIGRFFINLSAAPTSVQSTSATTATPIVPATPTSPTAVNETQGDKGMEIYTMNREIVIKGQVTEKNQANLYEISGRLVHIYKLQQGDITILPLPDLSSGVYFIKVYGNGVNKSQKILLE